MEMNIADFLLHIACPYMVHVKKSDNVSEQLIHYKSFFYSLQDFFKEHRRIRKEYMEDDPVGSMSKYVVFLQETLSSSRTRLFLQPF